MISSKDLLDRTGISRATLNNYISLGLLSRPSLRSADPSGARVLGYFPADAFERIERIRELKQAGWSMSQIVAALSTGASSGQQAATDEVLVAAAPTAEPSGDAQGEGAQALRSLVSAGMQHSDVGAGAATLQLSLDEVSHPAYMFSYGFELTWYNEEARRSVLGGFERLAAGSAERHILPMVATACARQPGPRQHDLLRAHVQLIRGRLTREMLLTTLRGTPISLQNQLAAMYDDCESDPSRIEGVPTAVAIPLERPEPGGRLGRYQLVATYFREGVLVIVTPDDSVQETLAQFLSRRDLMIRHLLRKRLPVLTPLAVLVSDLQGSTRICSELPPEEYFELINEIWAGMDPIFRAHGATHGKHVGDGMVYFFFPQPDSHYVFNALQCAHEMREAMRKISSRWLLRKGWFNELHLNTGLHEGTEWLGTFQTATSIEFAVLGDTINQAARLSDFARHGTIWASKGLISKLSSEERVRLQYGVARRNHEGREVFVESTFAQIGSITDIRPSDKVSDVAQLAVTEIRSVQ